MSPAEKTAAPPAGWRARSKVARAIVALEAGKSVTMKTRAFDTVRALASFWGRRLGRRYATRQMRSRSAIEVLRLS